MSYPYGPKRTLAMIVLTVLLLGSALVALDGTMVGGLKFIREDVSKNVVRSDMGDVVSLGDLDRDGFMDMALTLPFNSSVHPNGGSIHLFWGAEDGFRAISPELADITIIGDTGYLLGTSVLTWDPIGLGNSKLVVGCPGAGAGAGSVLVFDSVLINDAPFGSVFTWQDAEIELTGTSTSAFGLRMVQGELSGDKLKDLAVFSNKSQTADPKLTVFFGGPLTNRGVALDLPQYSVTNITACTTIDLFGEGREAVVYSTPQNGEIRIVYLDILSNNIAITAANATGVLDFEGSYVPSGTTFGYGAGNDGWDKSGTHLYDTGTGYDSVRFNQATGNARNYNRAITRVKELQIEIGGVLATSNNNPQSGAYGVSFQLTAPDLAGIDSAVLSFDYSWEDGGFENDERMWIKGRFWAPPGTTPVWLGSNSDSTPQPDGTPEVWTMAGRNGGGGNGQDLSGKGNYEVDLITSLNGAGEYYLELGGKVSRWTNNVEYGSVGFDNISFTLRSVQSSIKLLTGAGMMGTELFSEDVDDDGREDLMVTSTQDGKMKVFKGNLLYWKGLAGLNQGMANFTIAGTAGSSFGRSVAMIEGSLFTPEEGLLISDPSEEFDGSSGAVHLFQLPLPKKDLTLSDAIGTDLPGPNRYEFGFRVLSIGDYDTNTFHSTMAISFDGDGKMVAETFERSPTPPYVRILYPHRHEQVSGVIEIRAQVTDVDGDAGPSDARFYRSLDNQSWNFIGDGMPDRTEGDVAVKVWNTSLFENNGYFLKVQVADVYGYLTARYTDRVDVLNHAPPVVDLVFPADGSLLKGIELITARVQTASLEVLEPPVHFMMSRDNATWTEFANRSQPEQGSSVDYIAPLDTEDLNDGPIWFRLNASTEYGLGAEDRNLGPCMIDNSYMPQLNFTSFFEEEVQGTVNITVKAKDKDGDIVPPVKLHIQTPGMPYWDDLANMTGPSTSDTYHYLWDTTTVENGEYQLKASVSDSTHNYMEAVLNTTMVVHNYYTPTVQFEGLSSGETIKGIVRIKARVTDRDNGVIDRNIKFFYRQKGIDVWSTLGQASFSNSLAFVDWETTLVPNGQYDLLVEAKDSDNLTASTQLNLLRVKNIFPPELEVQLPSNQYPLKGVVRFNLTIKDDEPINEPNILVEVFTFDHWETVEGVTRTDPGGMFIPWDRLEFQVEWDTAEMNGTVRRYPDGPGYDIKVTVTDASGATDSFLSPVTYEVENGSGGGNNGGNGGKSLPPWLIAVLVLLAIVLLIVVFIVLFVWKGEGRRKEEEEEETMPAPQVMMPPPERPSPAEEPVKKDRSDAIYSPPGWDRTGPPAEPTEHVPLYTAEAETPYLGEEPVEEEPSEEAETFDRLHGKKEARHKPSPKKAHEKPMKRRLEEEPSVELPEGVIPIGIKKQKKMHVKKPEPKAPEPEEAEEEWGEEAWEEEEEEVEEMEEMEEMEEEAIVIKCKCGKDIEIHPSEDSGRFKCKRCGRTGRVKL